MSDRFPELTLDLRKLKTSTRHVPFRLKFFNATLLTVILLRAVEAFSPILPTDVYQGAALHQARVHDQGPAPVRDLLMRMIVNKKRFVQYLHQFYTDLQSHHLSEEQKNKETKRLVRYVLDSILGIEIETKELLEQGNLAAARVDIDMLSVYIKALIKASGSKHDELVDLLERLEKHYEEAKKRLMV
ncbi:MAG: hypothetical protein ABIC95_04865 [archaeon]